MKLALVKLTSKRGDRIIEFVEYISAEVAKLGVDINGEKHRPNEYSRAEIIKIFGKE